MNKPKTVPITVWVPEHLKQFIDSQAAKTFRTKSGVVIEVLNARYEEEQIKEQK